MGHQNERGRKSGVGEMFLFSFSTHIALGFNCFLDMFALSDWKSDSWNKKKAAPNEWNSLFERNDLEIFITLRPLRPSTVSQAASDCGLRTHIHPALHTARICIKSTETGETSRFTVWSRGAIRRRRPFLAEGRVFQDVVFLVCRVPWLRMAVTHECVPWLQ